MEEVKNKSDSSIDNQQEIVDGDGNEEKERDKVRTYSPSNQKNFSLEKEDEELESAKAEMGEVMEENQRLKMYLERMMKDYRTLQMQYQGIVLQKEGEKSTTTTSTNEAPQETEESDLVSLSLGRTSSDLVATRREYGKDKVEEEEDEEEDVDDDDGKAEGLSLGLDCKFDESLRAKNGNIENNSNSSSSSDEVKEENGETWPPSKVLKTMRSGEDNDVSQQNPTKRARVSVRVRCDAPTMNDGCQWRKYGQKIAKGNPCPRAYYRCTVAPSCPVRKQVQRCAEDMSILITTYEGTHNHSLPISATAMASTTSAAACMLMSGSSSSSSPAGGSTAATVTTTTNTATSLNGLNFSLSGSSKPKPYYIPTSSMAPTLGHPTIVLDLTSTMPSSSSNLHRMQSFPPKFSTTNLNFSSLESNPLPISWNYGSHHQPYNTKSHISSSSLSFGRQPQQPPPQQDTQTILQSYLSENNLNNNNTTTHNVPNNNSQSLPQETIAAATKAITSDPNFQSVLAAALTSIIGTSNNNNTNSINLGNNNSHWLTEKVISQNPKAVAEPFPILSSFSSSLSAAPPPTNPINNTKCSSSLLSRPQPPPPTASPATNNNNNNNNNPHHHHSNLMFHLQQTSKSKSTSSPGETK